MLNAENQRTCSGNTESEISNIRFGNFTMRKPFSKIVAETVASVSEFLHRKEERRKKIRRYFFQKRNVSETQELKNQKMFLS